MELELVGIAVAVLILYLQYWIIRGAVRSGIRDVLRDDLVEEKNRGARRADDALRGTLDD